MPKRRAQRLRSLWLGHEVPPSSLDPCWANLSTHLPILKRRRSKACLEWQRELGGLLQREFVRYDRTGDLFDDDSRNSSNKGAACSCVEPQQATGPLAAVFGYLDCGWRGDWGRWDADEQAALDLVVCLLHGRDTCVIALSIFYVCVDAIEAAPNGISTGRHNFKDFCAVIFTPLRWMGMNAILIFTWHGLATAVLNSVYWQSETQSKRHNLVDWLQDDVFGVRTLTNGGQGRCANCQLCFVLFKIACFALATGYCARVGYFWKL